MKRSELFLPKTIKFTVEIISTIKAETMAATRGIGKSI
jgi:hypothetical protein